MAILVSTINPNQIAGGTPPSARRPSGPAEPWTMQCLKWGNGETAGSRLVGLHAASFSSLPSSFQYCSNSTGSRSFFWEANRFSASNFLCKLSISSRIRVLSSWKKSSYNASVKHVQRRANHLAFDFRTLLWWCHSFGTCATSGWALAPKFKFEERKDTLWGYRSGSKLWSKFLGRFSNQIEFKNFFLILNTVLSTFIMFWAE